MSKKDITVVNVPKSCKVAAYGHMVFNLKKGKNDVPSIHADSINEAIEESGLFEKGTKK